MFGLPLHPMVVHFPVVLAILLPISILGAFWAIRKGATARKAWLVPVVMAGALALSAFVAVQTGKGQEERVENVVGERSLESHEEAAERFLVLSGVLLVVAIAGILPGIAGRAARIVTAAGAAGLMVAGAQVGHSGGLLVYRDGAASAYTTGSAAPGGGEQVRANRESDDR